LHNADVEPICRKYLELRYRLLPYLYSAVHESAASGMPIMRALWLHYPDDSRAAACEDQYLWGSDILVAPVVEKGATSRKVYLPKGTWFDFWSGERFEGARDISRAVDLETMPLFVRAGGILPLGPVKQYVDEQVEQPLSISIYPGADGTFLLYEDDGKSFNYRRGDWMGTKLAWEDSRRVLSLRLAPGSRMMPPLRRKIEVKLLENFQTVEFNGRPVEIRF
jgi:alpha-glucosidase/alpha-D-xyloside xylohydrolase